MQVVWAMKAAPSSPRGVSAARSDILSGVAVIGYRPAAPISSTAGIRQAILIHRRQAREAHHVATPANAALTASSIHAW